MHISQICVQKWVCECIRKMLHSVAENINIKRVLKSKSYQKGTGFSFFFLHLIPYKCTTVFIYIILVHILTFDLECISLFILKNNIREAKKNLHAKISNILAITIEMPHCFSKHKGNVFRPFGEFFLFNSYWKVWKFLLESCFFTFCK